MYWYLELMNPEVKLKSLENVNTGYSVPKKMLCKRMRFVDDAVENFLQQDPGMA